MSKSTDVTVIESKLYLLPVDMRVPLKFGSETVSSATMARAAVTVEDRDGNRTTGWGETPLSATWVWPSSIGFKEREDQLIAFCELINCAIVEYREAGHPMELGAGFKADILAKLRDEANRRRGDAEPMPYLAALVCFSLFDIAIHDAFGRLVNLPVYETYNKQFMSRDLSTYLTPAEDADVTFEGLYPQDFFVQQRPNRLPVWHLVGGLDPLDESEATGGEPDDGYPVFLTDWIKREKLNCLKIKLRGNDLQWDIDRTVAVGKIAQELGVNWLSTDFNCTVTDPEYVNEVLDRLRDDHPRTYGMNLYVEQPFPHDLEANRIDVHSVSARKPLFMDESAHDWTFIKLGRSLGWSGVALKTCKTQTGALLSTCWAKAHGMPLMVQDLTNPMLAMIPHALLAAHAGTIMGIESNAPQFYPEASTAEAKTHPGLYRRLAGQIDLSTLTGPGFGYRDDEIIRELPDPKSTNAR